MHLKKGNKTEDGNIEGPNSAIEIPRLRVSGSTYVLLGAERDPLQGRSGQSTPKRSSGARVRLNAKMYVARLWSRFQFQLAKSDLPGVSQKILIGHLRRDHKLSVEGSGYIHYCTIPKSAKRLQGKSGRLGENGKGWELQNDEAHIMPERRASGDAVPDTSSVGSARDIL